MQIFAKQNRFRRGEDMDKIAIFCSASDHIAPVYVEKARELGAWMGQNRKWLVYGGSARAAKEQGAMIMGVVPDKLEERGRVSNLLDVTFHTVNLSDRKDIMLQEADVMVALPGGVGGLDEAFHVMAGATIGYLSKQDIFYNVEGFWNGLLDFLSGLEAANFAHRPLNNFYQVANTFEELTALLK